MSADTTDPRIGTTFRAGPWSVAIRTMADPVASPFDADCYTAAQIAAWRAGEWAYVGCIVEVAHAASGVALGSASLWGMESGWYTYTDEDDTVTGQGLVGPYVEAVDSLIAEAIAKAEATRAALCQDDKVEAL